MSVLSVCVRSPHGTPTKNRLEIQPMPNLSIIPACARMQHARSGNVETSVPPRPRSPRSTRPDGTARVISDGTPTHVTSEIVRGNREDCSPVAVFVTPRWADDSSRRSTDGPGWFLQPDGHCPTTRVTAPTCDGTRAEDKQILPDDSQAPTSELDLQRGCKRPRGGPRPFQVDSAHGHAEPYGALAIILQHIRQSIAPGENREP
jgi:hypothetical protein